MPKETLEKIVYQVTRDGTYIGTITLSEKSGDVSPLDGEWLIPAGCVDVAPPSPGENQVAKWQNGAWVLEDIPQSEPEPAQTVAEAQIEALAAINMKATDAYTAGFQSSATGNPLWYDSDTNTQNQITSAALLALGNASTFATMYPSGITIRAKEARDADDSTKQQYVHSAAQIVTLAQDMQTMLAGVKAKVWSYQEQIYACSEVAAVEKINISF